MNDWVDRRTRFQVYMFGLCLGFVLGFSIAMAWFA
jgi:hypothetical protein